MRHELTGDEWATKPMLPKMPRGVPRVNDVVCSTILQSGAPWRVLPNAFGPYAPVATASFVGGEQASGAGLSKR